MVWCNICKSDRVWNPTRADLMNLLEFRQSLQHQAPGCGLSLPLAALWWDAKGDWAKAHETAQEDESPQAAWVHAYLHRKEGDSSNASYWYKRAGRAVSSEALEVEWEKIVGALLE